MKINKDVYKTLNAILINNYDVEASFKNASQIVKKPRLKSFFKDLAKNRYSFSQQLIKEMNAFFQNIDEDSSLIKENQTTWVSINESFKSRDEQTILLEVIRGEEVALIEYKNSIYNTDLPNAIKILIIKQIGDIENTLRIAKNMRVVFS